MQIDILTKDGKTVLAVSGRIDTLTSGEFQQQALAALEQACGGMLIDCGQLEYVSSAGLRSLLVLAKYAQGKGREVCLCRLNHLVGEILEMSGFDSFFSIQENF